MKLMKYILLTYFVIVSCEPQKPLVFPQWPPHNTYLPSTHHKSTSGKLQGQKTLVVQIRSDKRVPFVIKRPTVMQQHALASNHQQVVLPRPIRPVKMAISPHFLMKQQLLFAKHFRKPTGLKYKFATVSGDKPYSYEKPSFTSTTPEFQKLPIKNAVRFSNNHLAPIHTIPAPNLSTIHEHKNTQHHELPLYSPPSIASAQFNQQHYQVTEEYTHDQTILDPSGKQKYFAPDPDPSLPTAKIRTSIESYNTPSNNKPLPSDVQSNYLPSLSSNVPLLQESQNYLADIYGVSFPNQPQLQQFFVQQAAPSINAQNGPYNPTYLVTQSKNLYQQHQKQKNLFRPNKITYANADLTQEVASDGQILQSAKDNKNVIHPAFNGIIETSSSSNAPNFAALIAAPLFDTALQHDLQNQQKQTKNTESEGGFVVSNYFGNADQNPESYQEYLELSKRQRENDRTLAQANLEIQKKLLEQEIQLNTEPATSAYEEHQRLLQQQLGVNPLRIFVPDEDQSDSPSNIKKRSDSKHDKEQIENNLDDKNVKEVKN